MGNPLIPASTPTLLTRIGDDYFVANSTLEYFRGYGSSTAVTWSTSSCRPTSRSFTGQVVGPYAHDGVVDVKAIDYTGQDIQR
jgi:hypothetical protein